MGVNYCLQCRRIFEEVEAASALISQAKLSPHGNLKVVSGRHFGIASIIPHMKEFLLKYPKIKLDLELAERIPDLTSEGIDVLIGMSVSATGDVIQKRIATTSYTYCASPAYLEEFGVPEKPEDLKNHHYITHSMRRPDDQLEFEGKRVVKVTPYIKVNDSQSMLKLALDGLGIVKLHRYVVSEYLEQGILQEILSAYSKSKIPIYVAYPQRRYIASKVRCFIDFFIEKYHE